MGISHQSSNRRQRSRDPLERRMDQWIETGRQFVDGVAGNRPGQRRNDNLGNANRASLENAGRWVGEKLDWFFEEDDDWVEPIETEQGYQERLIHQKRPLEAISLRVPKALAPSAQLNSDPNFVDEWPDDSSFRIDRWKRSKVNKGDSTKPSFNNQRESRSFKRPLPRSSRRRN